MTIKAQTKGLQRYADFEDYIETKPSDFEIKWGVSAGDATGKIGFEEAMKQGLNAVQELTAFLNNVIQTIDSVVDVVALSLGIVTDAFSALGVIIREVLESIVNLFTGLSVNWLLHFPQSYKTRRTPSEIMYDLGMAYVDKKDANRPITVQETFGFALVALWSLPNIEQVREKWGQVKRLFSGIGSEFNELNPSGIEIPKSNANLAETGYLVQALGPSFRYYYDDHEADTLINGYFNLQPNTVPIDRVNLFLERNRLELLRFLESIPIAPYMDLIQVEEQIEYNEDNVNTHYLVKTYYFGGFSSLEDAETVEKLLEGYYSYTEEYVEDGYPYYLDKYAYTTDLSIIDRENKKYPLFGIIRDEYEKDLIESEETKTYYFETIRKKIDPQPESTISSRYNQYEEKFGGIQSQLLSDDLNKVNTTGKFGLVFRGRGSREYNENEANSLLRTLDLIPYTKYLNFFAIRWRENARSEFSYYYVLGCFENDKLRKILDPIYRRIHLYNFNSDERFFVLGDTYEEDFDWSYEWSIQNFRENLEPNTQVKLIRKAIPYSDRVSMSGQAPDFNGKLALTDFYYIRDLVFKLSNLAINVEKRRTNVDRFKSLIQATERRIQRITDTTQEINKAFNSLLAWFFIGDGAKLMSCVGTGSDRDFANALINAPMHPSYPNTDLFEENQNQSKQIDPISSITQESINNNVFSGAFLLHFGVSDPRADYQNLKKFIDLFMRVTDTEELNNKLQPLEDKLQR